MANVQSAGGIHLANSRAILVTGGSGYIGSNLIKTLSKRGEVVVSMYRHKLPEPFNSVFPVCSDLSSKDLLAAPLRGVDTVIHLAWDWHGAHELMVEGRSFNSKNISVLRNLISSMEDAGTKRLIIISAIGSIKSADDPFLKEKYYAECEVLNSNIPEKIILRSSVVFGGRNNEGKFINSIKRVMKAPGFYPLPSRKGYVYPLHIDDLTQSIFSIIKKDMPDPNAIIDIAGSEAYRVDELFKLVSEYYVKGSRLPLGSFVGNVLIPFFERDSRLSSSFPKLKQLLSLGSLIKKEIRHRNPIVDVIPYKLKSFRESVMGYSVTGL